MTERFLFFIFFFFTHMFIFVLYWNFIVDTFAKDQICQPQPFWRSRESGYGNKTRYHKESPSLFFSRLNKQLLLKPVSHNPETVTIRKVNPLPSSKKQTNATTATYLQQGLNKLFETTKLNKLLETTKQLSLHCIFICNPSLFNKPLEFFYMLYL